MDRNELGPGMEVVAYDGVKEMHGTIVRKYGNTLYFEPSDPTEESVSLRYMSAHKRYQGSYGCTNGRYNKKPVIIQYII